MTTSDPRTDEELCAEAERLSDAAVAGPWTVCVGSGMCRMTGVVNEARVPVCDVEPDWFLECPDYPRGDEQRVASLNFITASRSLVPELVRRLRERNAQVATLEAEKWQLRAQVALRRVKERPPVETFTKPWCKGSLSLGNACGTCEMCEWYREQIRRAEEPRVPVSELEELTKERGGYAYEVVSQLEEIIARAKGEHGPQ